MDERSREREWFGEGGALSGREGKRGRGGGGGGGGKLERGFVVTLLFAVRASLLRPVRALGSRMVWLVADATGTGEDSRLGAVGLVMPATIL